MLPYVPKIISLNPILDFFVSTRHIPLAATKPTSVSQALTQPERRTTISPIYILYFIPSSSSHMQVKVCLHELQQWWTLIVMAQLLHRTRVDGATVEWINNNGKKFELVRNKRITHTIYIHISFFFFGKESHESWDFNFISNSC